MWIWPDTLATNWVKTCLTKILQLKRLMQCAIHLNKVLSIVWNVCYFSNKISYKKLYCDFILIFMQMLLSKVYLRIILIWYSFKVNVIEIILFCSNSRERGCHTYTTSVTSGNSDVTIFAPTLSPWILQCPEAVSHSDQKDWQGQIGSTIVENSSFVILEILSINNDWNWSGSQSVGKTVAVRDGNGAIDFEEPSNSPAGLKISNVRVGSPSGDSIRFNIVESVVHPAIVASIVAEALWAVNHLLDWVLLLNLEENDWNSLNGANCRKCIAGSAWSLVFDWTHSSKWDPIYDRTIRNNFDFHFLVVFVFLECGEVLMSELFFGKVGKLVDSHVIGPSEKWVVGVDFLKILFKDFHPVQVFGTIKISPNLEFLFPGIELSFNRATGIGSGIEESSSCKRKSNQSSNKRLLHFLISGINITILRLNLMFYKRVYLAKLKFEKYLNSNLIKTNNKFIHSNSANLTNMILCTLLLTL